MTQDSLQVVVLLKDMAQGKLGADWKAATSACLSYLVFSLTHIPEESRTEEKLAKNRWYHINVCSCYNLSHNMFTQVMVITRTHSLFRLWLSHILCSGYVYHTFFVQVMVITHSLFRLWLSLGQFF